MKSGWDLPSESTAGPDPCPEQESPLVGSPTLERSQYALDGTISYGLVARIALRRPGFNFRVEHDLPLGVELVETRPKAKVIGDHLIWQLGRVDPGQTIRLMVVVRPLPGTVLTGDAIASFEATYSQNLFFETPICRPRLATRLTGPPTLRIGERGNLYLDIANSGNGAVELVQAKIQLPQPMRNPDGETLFFDLGTVAAGECVRIRIPVEGVVPGRASVRAEVTGRPDRHAAVEHETCVV